MVPQNLVDQKLFTFFLTQEIHKATRLQYPLCVLCLAPDLSRREITSTLIDRLARVSITQLRATDLVARLDTSGVALLLIDAKTRNLTAILARVKGDLEAVPGLTLSGGGGCYPQTATSGSELFEQAVNLMTRAKADGGNRFYLPS